MCELVAGLDRAKKKPKGPRKALGVLEFDGDGERVFGGQSEERSKQRKKV
jgi:hypothetical protein